MLTLKSSDTGNFFSWYCFDLKDLNKAFSMTCFMDGMRFLWATGLWGAFGVWWGLWISKQRLRWFLCVLKDTCMMLLTWVSRLSCVECCKRCFRWASFHVSVPCWGISGIFPLHFQWCWSQYLNRISLLCDSYMNCLSWHIGTRS